VSKNAPNVKNCPRFENPYRGSGNRIVYKKRAKNDIWGKI